ncbi:MAG: corrinoid protein-associated methyltransferase CpaM [Acidobacteriota bacterium]
MSSFVYMKVLESAPERYDLGIERLSGGRIDAVYRRVAELAAAPGVRLLDIGCGTGGAALACAGRGARVTGIDVNPGMLEVARGKAAAAGAEIEWLTLGALEVEDRFAAASLDAAVSCLMFSELQPEERSYLLGVLRSRLAPGGRLVLADEVTPTTRRRRWWRRARRLPAALWTYLLTQTSTHPVDDLGATVRAAGFAEVDEQRIGDDFAVVSAINPGASAS